MTSVSSIIWKKKAKKIAFISEGEDLFVIKSDYVTPDKWEQNIQFLLSISSIVTNSDNHLWCCLPQNNLIGVNFQLKLQSTIVNFSMTQKGVNCSVLNLIHTHTHIDTDIMGYHYNNATVTTIVVIPFSKRILQTHIDI